MPATHAKAISAATRFPPASQTEPAVASKKKKKKKGKGKAQDGSNPSNHVNHADHDGIDDEEDDLGSVNPAENELNGRRSLDADHGDINNYSNAQTAPLNAASHGQLPLRMSTTATAQAELLAAANELYKRMETEQMANDANDGEYWKQLPSHIRSFVETTYAHGAALSPNERSKSQAMLALAQTMVDEATSRFPTGGFPPPFDPSLLSDPKFAEKLGMKHGGIGAMNLMREYADEAYDDYNSENEEEDIDEEQQYEADDSSKKKKKKKKKGAAATMTNGTTPHPNPLPPLIPLAPNPAAAVTRVAPSAAQPRPSSRAAGKQPVYSQPTVPPARTTRSSATKSPVPPNPYNHGYPKSTVANGNATLAKRPTGGGDKDAQNKLWSSSTEQDRERIKEFWLGLSDVERRDLVKLEKEAVLKKMKEQQKHSCSCAVCGRKRNAIEEELEVLYDAYYEELEQYANHQQQYQSSGGKITPPPGPGPFPGSVAYDKNGAVIGGPPGATKHPARGARPIVNGARGRKAPPESEDEYEDDYDDDDDDYDDEDEEEEDEDDDDDSNARKITSRRRDLPPRAPLSRRPGGREDFFNFGNLTTAGPGNILTVADDLLKNDGGKFLEMMEQLAERRMQREEDAAKEVEVDSEEDEDDPEGSEEEDEDDEDNDDESEEEEDDPMSEEQKMEEGRKMFSIFAARMFEQRVLNAYREKVAAERQEQLLRELEDEDKIQAEKDAKRQKENQKKKDKKKQQKQAKEAEKAKKEAEKANEEAAARAKAEAHEEEMKKKREEERLKREQDRKQKEEEKARLSEERRKRNEEQKAIDLQRKKEKEERERKERLARQEKEAQAKAERAERERKAKEERTAREAKEREERERREKEDRERRERERLEQAKVEERKKQEAAAATKAKAGSSVASTSPRAPNYPSTSTSQPAKKPTMPSPSSIKPNGPLASSQRPVAVPPISRPPQIQPQAQPILVGSQQRPVLNPAPGMPINVQLPPTMGIPPIGMAPTFNSMVSPITMSPRVPYGPPSAGGVGHGPFSPLASFAQGQSQPGMMNGSVVGNLQQYSFDAQSPLMPQSQPASIQGSRPPSTLPPALSMVPPKTPTTPVTNGIPPMGVPPGAPGASVAHIRRASSQANPSPFGAIGKPRGTPSSIVGDDDRLVQPIMSPPSPDRVLGSSALVDENDTIVELPKRRGTAGRIDTIGTPAAVGARWGPRNTSWPAPNGPGPVGMQWSAAPGRPQSNRLDSPFSPT